MQCGVPRRAAQEVERAEQYLRRGDPLVDMMPRGLRLDIALFAAGGLAVARAIRRIDFDVWRTRPTLSRGNKLRLLAGVLVACKAYDRKSLNGREMPRWIRHC